MRKNWGMSPQRCPYWPGSIAHSLLPSHTSMACIDAHMSLQLTSPASSSSAHAPCTKRPLNNANRTRGSDSSVEMKTPRPLRISSARPLRSSSLGRHTKHRSPIHGWLPRRVVPEGVRLGPLAPGRQFPFRQSSIGDGPPSSAMARLHHKRAKTPGASHSRKLGRDTAFGASPADQPALRTTEVNPWHVSAVFSRFARHVGRVRHGIFWPGGPGKSCHISR